jgi:hypothetical protein
MHERRFQKRIAALVRHQRDSAPDSGRVRDPRASSVGSRLGRAQTNLFAMVFLLIGSQQVAEPAAWTDTITSEKIAVRVEKVLYEFPGHATFFIHVRLANLTHDDIGVDLGDKWYAPHPNQWGGSDLDHRTVIDERTLIPRELSSELQEQLRSDFKAGSLTTVSPGRDVDYYINFNASGRNDVQTAAGRYLLISIKGQLLCTDGRNVWDEKPNRDIALERPLTWSFVPEHARLIVR